MPKTTIYEASTQRLDILDRNGKVDKELEPELSAERLLELYRSMVRMRRFDEKALKLQRQGRMGTWASVRGQEAAQAGLALAMVREDWLIPSFRENAIMLVHGIPGEKIYRFWKGDENGLSHLPEGIECLPPAIPIASQLLHAVGIGLVLKRQGKKAAAVAFCGDGGSSQGDFHEALNFGGVFQTNTIFFVQNNAWAISVPFSKQTRAASIAQKAHAYGIPGVQVDGNDALAVYAASQEALERARSGGGPTLIEAVTYRMESHTTADEASRYRPAAELEHWAARDPIARFKVYLEGRQLWDEQKETALLEEAAAEVEGYVTALEDMPPPQPQEVFDSMYKEMPWFLREQREGLLKEVKR